MLTVPLESFYFCRLKISSSVSPKKKRKERKKMNFYAYTFAKCLSSRKRQRRRRTRSWRRAGRHPDASVAHCRRRYAVCCHRRRRQRDGRGTGTDPLLDDESFRSWTNSGRKYRDETRSCWRCRRRWRRWRNNIRITKDISQCSKNLSAPKRNIIICCRLT
jgi:hypothetical protein